MAVFADFCDMIMYFPLKYYYLLIVRIDKMLQGVRKVISGHAVQLLYFQHFRSLEESLKTEVISTVPKYLLPNVLLNPSFSLKAHQNDRTQWILKMVKK